VRLQPLEPLVPTRTSIVLASAAARQALRVNPVLGERHSKSDIPSKPNRYAASGLDYAAVCFYSAVRGCLHCAVGLAGLLAAGGRLPNSACNARPRTTPLFNGYLQHSSAIADESMAIART
jgi:hypothetical protein